MYCLYAASKMSADARKRHKQVYGKFRRLEKSDCTPIRARYMNSPFMWRENLPL